MWKFWSRKEKVAERTEAEIRESILSELESIGFNLSDDDYQVANDYVLTWLDRCPDEMAIGAFIRLEPNDEFRGKLRSFSSSESSVDKLAAKLSQEYVFRSALLAATGSRKLSTKGISKRTSYDVWSELQCSAIDYCYFEGKGPSADEAWQKLESALRIYRKRSNIHNEMRDLLLFTVQYLQDLSRLRSRNQETKELERIIDELCSLDSEEINFSERCPRLDINTSRSEWMEGIYDFVTECLGQILEESDPSVSDIAYNAALYLIEESPATTNSNSDYVKGMFRDLYIDSLKESVDSIASTKEKDIVLEKFLSLAKELVKDVGSIAVSRTSSLTEEEVYQRIDCADWTALVSCAGSFVYEIRTGGSTDDPWQGMIKTIEAYQSEADSEAVVSKIISIYIDYLLDIVQIVNRERRADLKKKVGSLEERIHEAEVLLDKLGNGRAAY